jgi:hypothetical protein
MNGLFDELDDKTNLALDGHNILYLLGTSKTLTLNAFAPFMGPAFVWSAGEPLISGYWGGTYDHTTYTQAIAAANIGTPAYWTSIGSVSTFAQPYYSTTEKWVRLHVQPYSEFGILRGSLEAHRIPFQPPGGQTENYWVVEVNAANFASLSSTMRFVERRRRTIQAELILEGVTSLLFEARWNKYDFFRIHNCNAFDATVTFKATDGSTSHTVTVPPYGSQCVRRTGVDGTYTDGFRYFQTFLPGDARFFAMGTGLKGGGNNVVCPAVIVPWVNSLLGGRPYDSAQSYFPPTVWLDPSIRAPLPARSAALYGDPDAGSTLIGDLLHHKGAFYDVGLTGLGLGQTPTISISVKQFNGYSGIVADMAAQGVTAQFSGDNLQLKATDATKQHDFVSFGTNLFVTGSSTLQRTYLNGSAFITIDRHMPGREFYPFKESSLNVAASYTQPNGTGVSITYPLTFLEDAWSVNGFAQKTACSILPHSHTVADAAGAQLGTLCGNTIYPDGASSVTSWANVGFKLGGSGLWLCGDKVTSLKALPAWTRDVWPALEGWEVVAYNKRAYGYPAFDVISGSTRQQPWVWQCEFNTDGSITQPIGMHFERYGWGNYDNTNDDNGLSVGREFLPPGTYRRYGDAITYPTASPQRINSAHCDFRDPMNADGSDIEYKGAAVNKTSTSGITLLTPWPATGQNTSGNANADAPFDLTSSSLRHKFLPTMQLVSNDHLRGAWLNLTTGTDAQKALYWKGARGAYLGGQIPSDAPGQFNHRTGRVATIMYGFFRMPLCVEHFNCLAEKVNQATKYKPLNWIDHGVLMHPTDPANARLRCYPNNYGLTQNSTPVQFPVNGVSTQIRPAGQFARYTAGDAITTAMQSAGLLLNRADLPASFQSARARVGQNLILTRIAETVATDTVTPAGGGNYSHSLTITNTAADFTISTQSTGFARTDLNAISSYSWASIAAVQAYAEARGYKFIHTAVGVPLILKEFNLPATFTVLRQSSHTVTNSSPASMAGQRTEIPTFPFPERATIQQRHIGFVIPEAGEATEWLASAILEPYGQLDTASINLLCCTRAADVFTRSFAGVNAFLSRPFDLILKFEVAEQFRATHSGGTNGYNPVAGTHGTSGIFPVTGDLWTPTAYARDYSSAGVTCNSKLVTAPSATVAHTANASETDTEIAWNRINSGPQYIPFALVAAPAVQPWEDLPANTAATFSTNGFKVCVGEDHLTDF